MALTPHNFPIRKQLKRGLQVFLECNKILIQTSPFPNPLQKNQIPLWTKHEDGYHVAQPQGKVG